MWRIRKGWKKRCQNSEYSLTDKKTEDGIVHMATSILLRKKEKIRLFCENQHEIRSYKIAKSTERIQA